MYLGQWKADEYHGVGRYMAANGDGYEGQFKAGKMHGEGVHTSTEGAYEGTFVMGKRHGHGVVVDPEGRTFEGQFADGFPVSDTFYLKAAWKPAPAKLAAAASA